jgi:hypothetical protein
LPTTRRRRDQLSRGDQRAEVAEAPGGRARLAGLLGPGKVDGEFLDQAQVASQAEDEVDPVRLAPNHQRLAREAAVGAQQDAHAGPAGADLADDARDLLDRSGRGVDVGAPELRRQQVTAAEDVEGQVAVGVVVAVEEPTFLVAVQRHVGCVQVEDELPRRRAAVGVEEQVDEQRLDRGVVVANAVVAPRLAGRRVLQPVQRALARQRGTAGAVRLQLAGEDGQHRIVPQVVVVDEVLIAERDPEHPLADQGGQPMLDAVRVVGVAEARREPPDQADGAIGGAEQQRAGIGGDRPTIEAGDHGTALDRCELEQRLCVAVRLCCRRTFADSEPRCTYGS